MTLRRLVVGISGASCTGKTTLTKLLKVTFPWASVVHQDAYYHPNDPKYHVYLPDVKHFNWDIKSAMDLPQMEADLQKIVMKQHSKGIDQNEELLCFPNDAFVRKHQPQEKEVTYLKTRYSQIPLTIIEGIILFNHPPLYRLCDLRYFLTLDQEELFSRRRLRVYHPPNPKGYLEKYVWPEYVSRLEETRGLPDIQYFDCKRIPLVDLYHQMKQTVTLRMASMISPTTTPTLEESPPSSRPVQVSTRG